MDKPDERELAELRDALRRRAAVLRIDRRVHVRFDESDLVRETLLKADASWKSAQSPAERLAWLFTIQDNILIDKHREHFAQKRDVRKEVDALRPVEQALVESTWEFVAAVDARVLSPSEDAARNEERAILDELLKQLPEDYRQVIQLRGEGLTVSAIAEELKMTRAQVAGMLVRAMKKLGSLRDQNRKDPP